MAFWTTWVYFDSQEIRAMCIVAVVTLMRQIIKNSSYLLAIEISDNINKKDSNL